MKKYLCALLALCCLLSLSGCKKRPSGDRYEEYSYSFSPAQTTDAAQTQVPVGETTVPQTTLPATTAAQTTVPATMFPATTAPATTVPPTTVPQTTVPHTTVPQTTVPATTAPATTVPQTTAPPTTAPDGLVCTVEIRCDTVLDHPEKLKKNKAGFIPAGGVVLAETQVAFRAGETVFDVLRRVCADNTCPENCVYCRSGGIQLEYTYTPGFNTYYVEGIHQLYEKDCGVSSGWMFSVNGAFPNVGAGSCAVAAGDRIVFAYTCDMGEDIGNVYTGN